MIKIYGKNCVTEAIKANAPIKKLFFLKDNNKDGYLKDLAIKKGIAFEMQTKEFMQKHLVAIIKVMVHIVKIIKTMILIM